MPWLSEADRVAVYLRELLSALDGVNVAVRLVES